MGKRSTGPLRLDRPVDLDPSAPAQTTAATDTSFKFSQRVNSVLIQNNTSAPLYANLDKAASAGTLAVPAGMTLILDWPCSVLHLWTTLATNVNGASAGAIFVAGGV